ncbi:unnamed protein product, partial [Prorocentrum cordatum]
RRRRNLPQSGISGGSAVGASPLAFATPWQRPAAVSRAARLSRALRGEQRAAALARAERAVGEDFLLSSFCSSGGGVAQCLGGPGRAYSGDPCQ